MLTDPDEQATENREPANEMNKEDPTQGIPVWLQPFTVNLEDLETQVLAHSSAREKSDSEGDASEVETQKEGAQCSCLLPQKPNKILYEGPACSCGTSSRHSVEPVSNQNRTRDGEECTKVYRHRRRSQKLFIGNFVRIWQAL